MAKNYDDIGGVWRTIGGRRVFIKTGKSLSEAMKESGKFKTKKKEEKNYREIEKQLLEDYSKVETEDLEEYYKIFKEQGKEKFAERIKKELDKRSYEEYLKNYDYEKNMPEGAKFNKMLEESGVRTFADDIKEREQRRSESRNQLLQQKIKYANTQKGLKSMVDNDLATDITRNSFEDNEKLRRKHGKLEKIKTVKGVYGTSGALLRSRETGEYFVITTRNSNIDYWI